MKGIRFECQGSGKCCMARGDYGYVYVSLQDRRRLAVHLGISTILFTDRYTEKTDGLFHLKNPEKDCPFFHDNRCTVHQSRPRQCRTWPFWPENMKGEVWEREIASYCPGIGKGRLYSAEEIKDIILSGKEVPGCRQV
jgi:Fe-S-cluster containining protein